MGILVARTTLLAKLESSYGTDAAPAGTDGVLAMNVRPDPRFQNLIRNVQTASLGKLSPYSQTGGNAPPGGFSFEVEVRGAGSAYSTSVLPKVDPVLKSCGLGATVTAGTSVAYAPVSTSIPGCTIYGYMDGVIFKAVGCRGNARLVARVGQASTWNFEMQALSLTFADGSLVAGTYEPGNPQPPAWLKYGTVAALKLGTANYEPAVQSLEIGLGNDVQQVPNANVASGVGSIIIAGRDVQGSFDPEIVTAATYAFMADAQAATERALTAQIGTTAFNRMIITAPRMVPMGASVGDRSGLRTFQIPFRLSQSMTGDDEVQFLYS